MTESPLTPADLRCEHLSNPLGIQTARPFLTWALSSATSGLRLHWKVRLWDERGQSSDWSEPAWFEFAILRQEEWTGIWIGGGETECAPHFRKEFELAGEIKEARAYFSGLGYGELYLNGQRVGIDQLSPGWTDYDEREYREMLYPYNDQGRKRMLYTVSDVRKTDSGLRAGATIPPGTRMKIFFPGPCALLLDGAPLSETRPPPGIRSLAGTGAATELEISSGSYVFEHRFPR